MNVQILELLEGARQARGTTVVIDVFRAFSLEAWLYARGAKQLYAVGAESEARAMKERLPDAVLVGERGGKILPGFDFGNSPSQTEGFDWNGKTVIHTTSAGTQGLVAAAGGADEILAGSLVNAAAVAAYIRRQQPKTVSLVCMGNAGVREAPEDLLCGEYIRSLLLDAPLPDFETRIRALRTRGGAHFFDPHNQAVFPEADFRMCVKANQFSFVLRAEQDAEGLRMQPILP